MFQSLGAVVGGGRVRPITAGGQRRNLSAYSAPTRSGEFCDGVFRLGHLAIILTAPDEESSSPKHLASACRTLRPLFSLICEQTKNSQPSVCVRR